MIQVSGPYRHSWLRGGIAKFENTFSSAEYTILPLFCGTSGAPYGSRHPTPHQELRFRSIRFFLVDSTWHFLAGTFIFVTVGPIQFSNSFQPGIWSSASTADWKHECVRCWFRSFGFLGAWLVQQHVQCRYKPCWHQSTSWRSRVDRGAPQFMGTWVINCRFKFRPTRLSRKLR